MNIKVQGWDVEVSSEIHNIQINRTNHRSMDVSYEKWANYRDMLKEGMNAYPPVILEEDVEYPGYYNIIDGAHRIKALLKNGAETVKSVFVIKHN